MKHVFYLSQSLGQILGQKMVNEGIAFQSSGLFSLKLSFATDASRSKLEPTNCLP